MKIYLTDDHILLRDALKDLINSFPEMSVIGTANNGEELQADFKNGCIPDVVILDLSMPVMDGYETAEWLHKTFPDVKTLILTMHDSELALVRLLQRGVRGFLKKDIHPSELKQALISVAESGYYYTHASSGKLANIFYKQYHFNNSIDKTILSELEIEFLKFSATDLTYKEIAEKMNISPRAIDAYRDTLFDKLQVKNRVGLAIYAIRNGVVTF